MYDYINCELCDACEHMLIVNFYCFYQMITKSDNLCELVKRNYKLNNAIHYIIYIYMCVCVCVCVCARVCVLKLYFTVSRRRRRNVQSPIKVPPREWIIFAVGIYIKRGYGREMRHQPL